MKNNNLENDDVCEVFNSHKDAVNRVKERMLVEEQYSELSEFFKIFGNSTRLKIISLLCGQISKRRKNGQIFTY